MAIVAPRTPLTREQLQTLQTYILKKRKKKAQDDIQGVNETDSNSQENSDEPMPVDEAHNTDSSSEGYKMLDKYGDTGQQLESVPDIAVQLQTLREELESLKKKKHHLFQQLKKVLHEEEEKKQQQLNRQREQELSMMPSDYYRGDPRLPQASASGIKHSWSTIPQDPHLSKMQHTGSLQELHRYQTPLHFHHQGFLTSYSHQSHGPVPGRPAGFKDMSPHLRQGAPDLYRSKEGVMSPYLPQPHLGPSSFAQPPHFQGMTMSGNNLQYNNRGHYNVSSTGSSSQFFPPTQFQGVGMIQPTTGPPSLPPPPPPPPLQAPPDAGQSALYTPSQYIQPEMMMRHEYPPPTHYPFDPRQQRFMMGNPRHPPIKGSSSGGPFSPQDNFSITSPSHSPLASNERVKHTRISKK